MRRRQGLLFSLGCGLVVAFTMVAALAPLLAPYDPRIPAGDPFAIPGRDHLLGTNDLGQDVLSQVIYGARPSLIVAGLVTAISTTLSWLVGLIAGSSRRADGTLMAGADLILALPNIPLYLLVLTLLGPSLSNLIVVLALLSWPQFARIVRSLVLSVQSATCVEASRMLGASDRHIIRFHVLPVTLDVLPASIVLTSRFAIAAEATLAFLGLSGGNHYSWGTMLSWALADPLLFMRPVWAWLILPPTLAIVLLILAMTWVGGGIAVSAGTPAVRRRWESIGRGARNSPPTPVLDAGLGGLESTPARSDREWTSRSATSQAMTPAPWTAGSG